MQREITDREGLMCYETFKYVTCYGLSRDELILDLERTGHTPMPICVFEVLSFGLFNYFSFHFQLIFIQSYGCNIMDCMRERQSV